MPPAPLGSSFCRSRQTARVGEFCYPKDISRKGRDKFGFSGVALAALEGAEREATRLQFTGEAGVVGNPSWWAVKP